MKTLLVALLSVMLGMNLSANSQGMHRISGFYESTNTAGAQFQMYQAEALINFYLLEFKRTRQNILDIYLSAGLNLSHLQSSSTSTGRHLQQNSVSQQLGVGIEYLLRRENKTTYLFAETNVGTPFEVNNEILMICYPALELPLTSEFGMRSLNLAIRRCDID